MPPAPTQPTSNQGAGSEELLALLRSRLVIDKDNLDQELIEQPEKYYHVSNLYALSVSKRDSLKEELKCLEAELFLEYKEALEEAGKKSTEAVVTAHVQSNPEYKKLKSDFLSSNERTEVLSALRDAYNQRAWMLRELCSMALSGYFVNSSVMGEPSQQIQEAALNARRKAMRDASASISNSKT